MPNRDLLMDAINELESGRYSTLLDEDKGALGKLWQGMKDGLDWQSVATFGISDLSDAIKLKRSLKRYEDGEATGADKAFIQSKFDRMQAEGLYDGGAFYEAGKGLVESLLFMANMVLTGGVGGAVRAGAKGAVKALGKKAARETGEALVEKGFRSTMKKAGGKMADQAIGALVSPTTYTETVRRQNDNYMTGRDEAGDFFADPVENPESLMKSFANAYGGEVLSRGVETLVGPLLEEGVGLFKGMARIPASLGKQYRNVSADMVRQFRKMVPVEGFVPEMGEEVVEESLRNALIAPTAREKELGVDAWADSYTAEWWKTTGLTIGLMQALLGFPGMVNGQVDVIRNNHLANKYLKGLDVSRQEQAKAAVQIEDDAQRAKALGEIMAGADADQRVSLLGYVTSKIAQNMQMSFSRVEENQDALQDYQATLLGASSDGQNLIIGTDKNGNRYAVKPSELDANYAIVRPITTTDGVMTFGPPVQMGISELTMDADSRVSIQDLVGNLRAQQETADEAARQAQQSEEAVASLPELTAKTAVRPLSNFSFFNEKGKEIAGDEGSLVEVYEYAPTDDPDAMVKVMVTKQVDGRNGKRQIGYMPKHVLQEKLQEQILSGGPGRVVQGTAIDREGNAVDSVQPVAQEENAVNQEPAASRPEAGDGTAAARAVIPKDDKGRTLYEQVPAEDTVKSIYGDGRLNRGQADAFVEGKLRKAAGEMEKVSKREPKIESFDEIDLYADAHASWQEQMEAAQGKVDYWKWVQARAAEEYKGEEVDAGSGYELSEEVDENGRQFVLSPSGNIVFGTIEKESTLPPAPILLSEGIITNPVTNDGYGLVHIEARHGDQIRKAGYQSVVAFVEEVARNYEKIKKGTIRDGNQTYMLQLTDKHNNTLMIELSGDGTYWNVNTAGIFKTSYGKNRKEVYNRHTTIKQSAETVEASQDAERGDTQTSPSMNAPTTSDTKGTEKSGNGPASLPDANAPEETSKAPTEASAIINPLELTDQEKQRRGDMLRSAPAIEVSPNQITGTPSLSARKSAEKWWDEHVSSPMLYNTEVGEVEINRNSIESSLAHRYSQAKLDAITSLVDGFENAVYLGTMPDSRERGVVDHYFAYPINYNGQRSYVFCRAMQDANKNRLYVHEVFFEEGIKKGNALQTAASKPHGGIALYRDILANVLSGGKHRVSGSKGTEKSGNGTGEIVGRSATSEEADAIISQMEANAEAAPEIELTPENWTAQFGENGEVDTPIGKVKMGENQLAKMFLKKRVNEFGMVKPTLTKPDVILEEASQAKERQTAERPSSYLFVKTFNRGGEKIKFYASVTVSKEGMEVVISNHYMERNALEKKMEDDGIVYVKDSVLPIGSDRHLAENPQEGSPDLLPTRGSSESETKGSADSGEKQAVAESETEVQEEIAHLEEIKDYPGADKKLVQAEIDRLKGIGKKKPGKKKTVWDEAEEASERAMAKKKNENETASSKQGKLSDQAVLSEKVEEPQQEKQTPIEDAGEKIGGARKDLVREFAERINLNGKTFAQIFPNINYRKLLEQGFDPHLLAGLKFIREAAKAEVKKKRNSIGGNDNSLNRIRFFANYAKGFLLGDTSVDYSNAGWTFTTYGKRLMEVNAEVYAKLYDEIGEDIFDIDLSGTAMDVIVKPEELEPGERSSRAGTKYYRAGKEINARYFPRINNRPINYYAENEREEAINALVEKVKRSIDYGKTHKHKLATYYKPGQPNSYYVGTKIGGEVVALTPEGRSAEYGANYIREHNAELQAKADRIAEELKQQRKEKGKVATITKAHRRDSENKRHEYFWVTTIGKETIPVSEAVAARDSENPQDVFKELDKLKDAAQAKAQELLDEHESQKGWKPEMNLGGLRSRVGVDYREGRNVSAQDMIDTFGFRGVEFGNYVTQKERQKYLNECYDAIMDMAAILNISAKAVSLNGKLGLAIGARGTGKAAAHYEPKRNVVNLTKKSGAGTFAHEWWHAIDHYFGNGQNLMPATSANYGTEVREAVKGAIGDLMKAINNSEYFKRSAALDKYTGKTYYATDTELAARAFQDYITQRLIERSQVNDFLSHYTAAEDWNGKPDTYPYPTEKEAKAIREAFGKVFDTIEEKQENGRAILYHKSPAGAQAVSTEDTALRDALVDKLRDAGIEVVEDSEAGQRVLEMAGNGARTEAKRNSAPETASPEHSPRSLTVVSSADGAKILKNIDSLIEDAEKSSTQPKTFIGNLARALGAKRYGSGSEYATFETVNGNVVTIRLSNHNASSQRMDNAGRDNAISIVVTPKPNSGITNDGNAHIVEFYYNAIRLRRAEGKPLMEILKSIKQALYSGEYKDTTGLAEVQEVNADRIREHRVYHGSGTDFDAFDHSHMGEGEGAQAYGWGTYVTEVEGIGRTYAERMKDKALTDKHRENRIINSLARQQLASNNGDKVAALEYLRSLLNERWSDKHRVKEQIKVIESGKILPEGKSSANLYTVEIPEDTGENYLHWEKPILGKVDLDKLFDFTLDAVLSNGEYDDTETEMLQNDIRSSIDDVKTGEDLYKAIRLYVGNKAASEFLSRAGFAGISYPAQATTGGRADGARNYVIFNEKDAKITDHVRFFRTASGEAYGFTVGGKIYLDLRVATAETPIHEYTHLWAIALREGNPEAWRHVVELMKGTPVWEEVKNLYPELETEEEVADEVLSTYSGRRGADRLRAAMGEAGKEAGLGGRLAAMEAIGRVREALQRFWHAVADLLHIRYTTAEEVADRVLKDLLDGVNPGGGSRRLRLHAKDEAMHSGVTPEARAEKEAIRAEAQASGTYMKAPNGASTNLSERQWLQVRTKAFKEWFGDWEKVAQKKYLLGDNVVKELTGNEFQKDGVPLTEKVSKYYQEEYGGEVTRSGFGSVVLDERSVKDSISHGIGRIKSAAFAAVPEIIKDGIIIDKQQNWKGRNRDSFTFASPVKIGNETYVGVVIVTRGTGNQSNRFYLHEVALQKSLLDASIKTGTKADLHQGDIANVLKNIASTSDDASKVVDENGEPLVVYHGSRRGGFSVFDNTEGGRNSDAPDGTTFFASDISTAHTYSGTYDKPVYEREEDEDGYADDNDYPSIYACFLNIRDPYIEDFEGADWQGDLYGKAALLDQDGSVVPTPEGKRFFDSAEEAEAYGESEVENGTMDSYTVQKTHGWAIRPTSLPVRQGIWDAMGLSSRTCRTAVSTGMPGRPRYMLHSTPAKSSRRQTM